jgi:flagellar motor protein MotB
MRRIVIAASALCMLAVATGCASKTKERLNVALAENADLHQRQADLEAQYAQIAQENDRAQAEVQKKQAELAAAQQRAAEGAAYQMEAQRLQTALAAAEARQAALEQKMLANLKSSGDPAVRTTSPQLEAFRADVRRKLAQYHVLGVEVDVRTAQDGQQRVAIVLQNSFRAGSASLSYNASAVKTVVGLGKLVADSYPGSRVTVEGHTDSDPIRKSKWDSNEALSLARSEEVKKLLRQAGVADSRVSAVGMGSRNPVARGSTERAKAQNRRVEIYIYPSSS